MERRRGADRRLRYHRPRLQRQSLHPLKEQLEGTDYEVYTIGDAIKGRTAVEVIYEGAKLGVTI